MKKQVSFNATGNTAYFNTIDSHLKAYFVGFIASDGCINKSKKSNCDRLSVILDRRDVSLLEKLKEELNAPNVIQYQSTTNMVALQIQSQKLCDDLRQYGIDYRKTLILENILKHIPTAFKNSALLGLLDGDGCVYRAKKTSTNGNITEYPVVIFNGTFSLLTGIQEYLSEFQITTQPIRQIKTIYEMRIQRISEVEKIKSLLYKDCSFYLSRKRDKFNKTSKDQTISSPSVEGLDARVPIIA